MALLRHLEFYWHTQLPAAATETPLPCLGDLEIRIWIQETLNPPLTSPPNPVKNDAVGFAGDTKILLPSGFCKYNSREKPPFVPLCQEDLPDINMDMFLKTKLNCFPMESYCKKKNKIQHYYKIVLSPHVSST
ncbi:hypothetical protein WISP_32915 [Willisornis vidua]|uniref:Uncharacterized protein n=1 Tax=Willisornis vidua TaxID=1566151 RepID=A0ABQ9DJV8_9PASS|nr:hypothetical protein WISP_32915 [Willisornis vidua]